jgi:hypothetical protein
MALKLAPGEYVVMVQSFWSSGDVSHGIRVKAS